MKLLVNPAIDQAGMPAYKITIAEGGYKRKNLPEEYLNGECFWIRGGKKSPEFVLNTKYNPITKVGTDKRVKYKVGLHRTFNGAEIDRLIMFMRECGERLLTIRETVSSGYLANESAVIEI